MRQGVCVTLTGPDLWGSTLPYRVHHTPKCATYVCVSHFFRQRRGSRGPGFADIGPKVLIRYWRTALFQQRACTARAQRTVRPSSHAQKLANHVGFIFSTG